MPHNCECGATLGVRNKSGRCRPCAGRITLLRMHGDPVIAAKRRETMKNWPLDVRQAKAAHLIARIGRIPPDEAERRRLRGHELAIGILAHPDVVAKRRVAVARAAAKRTETVLGWCPPDRRAEYRHMVANQHLSGAEAKRIILDDIAAEARAVIRANEQAMREKHDRRIASEY